MDLNEAETRQQLINQQLARAGWNNNQIMLAEEVALKRAAKGDDYSTGQYESADYVLLDSNRIPIAIVEAKRTSRGPLAGQRQAADYADLIQAKYGVTPFIFLSNGLETWFWNRDLYPPHRVSGFFTQQDLENLRFIRTYRTSLYGINPNPKIAGRDYQIEALKRLTEALEKGHRKFLLVMATGTGKTRTAVALVDLLMRAKWIQRVLFLVDRRELARQAADAFKDYMPHEIPVRIEGGKVDSDAHIHLATYPSMLQVYQKLSPAYYDLIIADESHRSIYNKYKVLLDHFDSFQLGLTATPTEYIDHNTFQLFECTDGLPTFYYRYEDAVKDGYLADYKVLEAKTAFQIQGIKAGELPKELKRMIEEQGIELGEINFEGSDLERRVTNTGTNDAIVREFMDKSRKDTTGTLPAKTIIFCISHLHAEEIWKSFNRLYPDLQRRGFAEIIDSHMERVESTLDDFKTKDMPRVAISVDMLDTGIDVPEIRNLVFAKPVYSQVKFWQMIGRGTRRWRDPKTGKLKRDFLIIDHWNNFSYFKMNTENEPVGVTVPLPVRLFRARFDKLLLLQSKGEHEKAAITVRVLIDMLATLPEQNINVRPHILELRELQRPETWQRLDETQIYLIRNTIAPLCRFMPDVNLEEMTFELRTEQLALAKLNHDEITIDILRDKIVADLNLLPIRLQEVKVHEEHLRWAISQEFWENLDYERIIDLQKIFAPLMRYRRRRQQNLIRLSLPDEIATRRWVVYGPGGEGAFAESYREKVESFVRRLANSDPTLRNIKLDKPVTEEELRSLARLLERPDLYVTEDVLREVYEYPNARLVDFLRHMLGVSQLPSREEQIKEAFDKFIQAHSNFSAIQINFLRIIRSAIVTRNQLTASDLEQPPFNRVGSVHQLFSADELNEILTFVNTLAA